MVIWVVQMRADRFAVAGDLDPGFAAAFRRARAAGVAAHAFTCRIDATEVTIGGEIPIVA